MRSRTLLFMSLGGIAVVWLAVVLYIGSHSPQAAATSSTGRADVGGSFELMNHEGRMVSDASFRGKYMLVYFGYTFCPDVCPTTLSTMAEAIEILGYEGRDVIPIFITVDPDRDTPEHLATYVRYFHPRLVALTGTRDQVARAAKAYRIYYARVPEPGNDPDSYLVDHSSLVFLMDREGRYMTHFSHGTEASEMAEKIRSLL